MDKALNRNYFAILYKQCSLKLKEIPGYLNYIFHLEF